MEFSWQSFLLDPISRFFVAAAQQSFEERYVRVGKGEHRNGEKSELNHDRRTVDTVDALADGLSLFSKALSTFVSAFSIT
jgi:hypothetical protein